jgi:hypothetical protein
MKTISLLLCLFLLLSSTAFAADITGTWQVSISIQRPDGTEQKDSGLALLKQSGDVITGTLGPNENQQNQIAEGTIKDDKITIKIMPRPEATMTFELMVRGEKLVGTAQRTGSPEKATVEFARAARK